MTEEESKAKEQFAKILRGLRAADSSDLMAIMMLVMVMLGDSHPGSHIDINAQGMKFYLGNELKSTWDVKETHPVIGMMKGLASLLGKTDPEAKPFDKEKGETDGTQPGS